MDRRTFWASTGLGLMTLGAIGVLGYKSAHLSSATEAVAIVLFALGLFFTIAAMAGAPPARPAIDADHKAALRALVDRVATSDHDPYGAPQERQMLRAHYPRIADLQGRLVTAAQAQQQVWDALEALIRATVIAEFRPDDFWMNGGAHAKALHRLQGKAERVRLAPGEIRVQQVMVAGEGLPRHIGWDSHTLWDPTKNSPEAKATDAELDAKIAQVGAWFERMEASGEATAYRDALRDVAALRAALASAHEPIRHHAPILWSRRCFTCRPKKDWQIWR